MSDIEKNAQNPADNTTEASSCGCDKKSGGSEVILFFLIGFAISLAVGWILFPKLLYSKKEQPFNFNHEVHLEQMDEGCQSCHFFREDGTYSGIPKLDQCVDCHEEVQGESPDEEIFVNEYVANGKEVPWQVYARQPDCVFFSHAAHVKIAGMDCVSCHGHIGESTRMRPYEENRITGLSRDIWGVNIAGLKENSWDRMKMTDCGECHEQETGSKGSCFQCHK
jgi:hypothetical protein